MLANAEPGASSGPGRERRIDADLQGLLDARLHLLDVGDTEAASSVTAVICARLRSQGDLGRAAALGQATLDALPSPSASAAQWLHELGTLAQLRGDDAQAHDRHLRAVQMFAEVGDTAGVARSYESLGVLAHARGNYQQAERYYRAASCFHAPQPSWPAPAGPEPARPASLAPQPARPPSAQPQSARPPSAQPQPAQPQSAEVPRAALGLPDSARTSPRPAARAVSEAACAEAARAGAARAGTARAGAVQVRQFGTRPTGTGQTRTEAVTGAPASSGSSGAPASSRSSEAPASSRSSEAPASSRSSGAPAEGDRHRRRGRSGGQARRASGLRLVALAAGTVAIVATVAIIRTAGAGPAGTASARADLAGAGAAGRALSAGAGSADGVRSAGAGSAGGVRSAGASAVDGTPSAEAAAAAGTRIQAAAWAARQISASAVVGCDPAMCTALRAQGVPAGDLLVIGADGQSDPLGSDIVIATAAVRGVLGARLAQVYAPLVLAQFGTGSARIEVRVTAPDGAPAYVRALRADLAARATAGQQLARNGRLSEAPPARRELTSGQVDARLLTTIAALTATRQLRIVEFGPAGPGADPRVPLPSAEIAAAGPATAGPGPAAAELRAFAAFLRVQRSPYLASVISLIRRPGRPPVLRIAFGEPSPLNLLTPASAASAAAP